MLEEAKINPIDMVKFSPAKPTKVQEVKSIDITQLDWLHPSLLRGDKRMYK